MDDADQCCDVVRVPVAVLVVGVGPYCEHFWVFVDLYRVLRQKSDQVDRFAGIEVPVRNQFGKKVAACRVVAELVDGVLAYLLVWK